LTLSNYSFPSAHVEAVVTALPDCAKREGAPASAVSDFVLPLNGTRIIMAPPGADVCWRYQLPPPSEAKPGPARWSGWRRAYLGAGRPIDSAL
jgi:hypothetical protein